MKKLQILTSTAVIGLASAVVPAFAQEANSDVDTATSVNEPALVEKPSAEKSSDVKPALDAQKKVVEKTKEQLTDAQDKANEANKQVSDAQSDVTEATEAVKHAEEVASKATPQNIEANKTDQKANLADQKANETETANTDAKIATQTETVTKAQTGVSNAEQELKDANANVSAKETQVQSAKDAISGTGLAQAEDKLDEAKAETKGAEKNVTLADTALTDAKKADQKRQETIDNAQADVDAKTTLVNDAKENLESATTKANGATTTLSQAEDKLNKATKALDSVDIVKIPDLTQFKEDIASGDNDFMTDSGAKAIENTETSIGKNAKSQPVDIDNLTQAQKEEISHLYVQGLKQIREQLSTSSNSNVTKEAIESASKRARAYEKRGQNPLVHGHISLADGPTAENLVRLGSKSDVQNMYDLKEATIQALMSSSFADAPSKWGHLRNNLVFGNNVGIDVANINGDYWLVFAFDKKGTVVTNPTNAEAIQKAYEDAKAEKDTAQTASEKANDALKQASTDYANALDLKTSAEKTLADATATPIQTTVAENNLRLAKLALDSAQKRQAEAQKAVDNFSADLASKKQALDDAKSALESAKRVQEIKVQNYSDAKVELRTQEKKLEDLQAQKSKLVEEKDRLVEEAKALAEELKGYVEAPIKLAKAKTTLTEKQDALEDAQDKAEIAKAQVDAIQATLDVEQAKLADIQDKFNKLQDLEEKVKDNVIAKLPDGTIIAIPNTAPTAEELPEFDINSLNKGLDDNKILAIDDKGNVTVNGQAYTSQQQVSSKPIYSRVERAKTLPETGEQESLFGLVGAVILSGIYLLGEIRKRKG
ncbi:SEC10/PgrA surface exclusion domain-containing protein [Streptococcus infantis]|uniref:SEC10/PgrA surface exclusion domain-containing protein n=1 Tax=Streptococcus infantis TaxID=68892 RepID=UPI0039C319B8